MRGETEAGGGQDRSSKGGHVPLSPFVVDGILAAPAVRADAVARARRLLASPSWCRAEEVAEELVACYVGQRLP